MVRSALMLSARLYEDNKTAQLVASPAEFDALKEALNDTRIGGFGRIYTQENESCAAAQQAISQFFHNREPHELLLMYMTGFELINHEGEVYFVDINTDMESLEETAISASFIREVVKNCKSESKVLLIDSFARTLMDQQTRDEKELRLANFSAETRSVVLTSQDTLKTIRTEGGQKNPGFTESIIQGLASGDADLDQRGYISENELFLYVYKQMSKFGTAPNLFLSDHEDIERIRLARNIKFSSLPEYADDDDSLNFARFLRLVGQRKNLESEREKDTLRKVIRFQPEVTFLKRLARAGIVTGIFSALAAFITKVDITKAILIALIVLFGLVVDDLLRRRFN
ncbi:MAG: hypothetical protein AAF927_18055 [Bacteroidota bacterium]